MRRARLLTATAVAMTVLGLVACAPEGPGDASGTPTATVAPTATPTATPTPTPTIVPGADIELPGSCEPIYSSAMLALLNAENPPLNDPGVSMFSTGIEAVYNMIEEVSASGDSIRCTWGKPSESGLATNVSIVTAAQAATVQSALEASGLDCAPYRSGTLCRIVIDNSQEEYGNVYGETHYLAGNGWVATNWLNFAPEGYTEDIVATLWG